MARHRMQMFSLALLPAAILTIASTPILAQDSSHDSHHPKDQAATVPAKPAAPAAAAVDASATMMSNMKLMQDQMAKLGATTDPKERAKLLDEHLKTMQDTMKLMMGNNGGCPMMGAGQGGGPAGMMGNGNMMQRMMEQMMQHQNMMQAPAK